MEKFVRDKLIELVRRMIGLCVVAEIGVFEEIEIRAIIKDLEELLG